MRTAHAQLQRRAARASAREQAHFFSSFETLNFHAGASVPAMATACAYLLLVFVADVSVAYWYHVFSGVSVPDFALVISSVVFG